MEDRDPIKQLQHLLDDPGTVLEKISRIQSALASLSSPGAEPRAPATSRAETANAAQSETDIYAALLEMLRDMQVQIEDRLRPLALQAVKAETERLSEWIKQGQLALSECIARIDQSLLACVELVQEAQQQHSHLSGLKERLDDLGAAPSSLPEVSTARDPGEIINARVERLRRAGKI